MVPTAAPTWHPYVVSDYSLGDVARILKVSPRRLRYWQKTRLVEAMSSADGSLPLTRSPASSDSTGPAPAESETHERASSTPEDQGSSDNAALQAEDSFAFRDLVVLRAIVALLDKGIPLQRIRRNLETVRDRLPEMDDPAAALRLWAEDPGRIVVRHDGRLEEAGGQLLLEFDADPTGGPVASLADHDAAKEGMPFIQGGHGALTTADAAVIWFERGCELDADPEKTDAAVEAYEQAIELDPHFSDAYCNLGAVRYNQGRLHEARRAFEACLADEADHVEANFNLANVLEEAGEDDAALSHYRRALASDPLYPDLHINLALLYEKLGRGLGATQHWRRYLQLDPQGSWAEVARERLERVSGIS